MACGMYYKLSQPPKSPILYGYGKANRQRIIDVVNRLHRPSPQTTASSFISPELLAASGIDPGNLALLKKQYHSHEDVSEEICYRIRAEELAKRQQQRAKIPVMDDAQIDKVFKRLQRGSTKASELRQQPTQEAKEKPNAPRRRVKSAIPAASTASRLSTNDMQEEVRMKELVAVQQRKMNQLCLHTTVSGMKRRGVCAFCELRRAKELQKQEENSQMLEFLDPFSNGRSTREFSAGAREKPREAVTFASVDDERAHVERILSPTKASQGGLPLCDKMNSNSFFHHAYCCHPASHLVYGAKGMPLICGLKRSDKMEDVFNRLSRPKSSIY